MTGESSRHDAPDAHRAGDGDRQDGTRESPARRDEILSVVSHDLRNPIGAIITGVRFLLESPDILEDQEAVRDQLETILRSARSADRLLRDLLDLTSARRAQLSIERDEVHVPSLFDEVLTIVGPRAEEKGVELETDLGGSLPVLCADRERLTQVLLNLLDNAVKFTLPGGRVEVGAREEGDAVRLWVSDTGKGIPREKQDRIFEHYWHADGRSATGTGLGLAIVKEVVGRHGGQVDLESRPGEGSTFIVRLPVTPTEGDEDGAPDAAA